MLTAGLPQTAVAKAQNGLEYEVPIVGGWTYDAEQKCWTARADASALPEQVRDPGGVLDSIQIFWSEEYNYTGNLSLGSTGQLLLGKPGTITVRRYMLGTPVVRVYQIKPDGTVVQRYSEASENYSDDDYSAQFTIDAWTPADTGTWFAIYGLDWIGGFVVGFRELEITCLHEHTKERRTEPTCTAPGSVDIVCEICGAVLLHEELPPTTHSYQSVVTEPTCTEGGYTTHTCVRCGEHYLTDETEPLGHEYQSVVTEPTCTEGACTTRLSTWRRESTSMTRCSGRSATSRRSRTAWTIPTSYRAIPARAGRW